MDGIILDSLCSLLCHWSDGSEDNNINKISIIIVSPILPFFFRCDGGETLRN